MPRLPPVTTATLLSRSRSMVLRSVRPLEIRPVGLTDRNEALIEKILIVLGTEHSVERHLLLALVAPIPRNRVPRHRECAGVLDVDRDFQSAAVIGELEALHNVKLTRVRGA